jgi:acyl-CoA synthetase (AMP-forming)/AMP-acid ligase II
MQWVIDEIVVLGGNITQVYYTDPEATQQILLDRRPSLGDIITVDEDHAILLPRLREEEQTGWLYPGADNANSPLFIIDICRYIQSRTRGVRRGAVDGKKRWIVGQG